MIVILAFASVIMAMWALYIVGVQYKRGGFWFLLAPVAIVALIFDVILNYTMFAAFTFDWPRPGEYTFSRRLSRLVKNTDWRGPLAQGIAEHMLDPFDPSGKHIT